MHIITKPNPPLLNRRDDYNDLGSRSRGRRETGRRQEGETDSSGNYRSDNVWRSARANERSGDGNRDNRGGFNKPWERRGSSPARKYGDRRPERGDFRKSQGRREDRAGGDSDRRFERNDSFRKPWDRRDSSSRMDNDRSGGGFKKPWERRESSSRREQTGRGGRGEGFRKPWEKSRDDFRHTFSAGDVPAPAPEKPKQQIPDPPPGELLFGRQPVREILRAGRRIVNEMIFGDHIKDSEEILEIRRLCEERNIPVTLHKKSFLDSWLKSANHQGVLAVCGEYPYVEIDEMLSAIEAQEGNTLIVILDHIVDPQNLGSLLRTCEAAGTAGVVLPTDRAVGVTPAAVRASAGAAEHLPIARIPNLSSAIERFKSHNIWITGLEALPESKPYTEVDFKGRVCIVIGSEGHGLSSPVRKQCDNLVQLPMKGKVSSLNAGVAGAIALYEVLRQQN
jgi:23S rRNA (guanosine2251-2'-O)-methyltransferase